MDSAKEAYKNTGLYIENHFEDILEMVNIGSRAEHISLRLNGLTNKAG